MVANHFIEEYWTPVMFNELMGVTQTSLSDLCSYLHGAADESALFAFSAGEALPKIEVLIRLSSFFGAPIDLLLGRVSKRDFENFLESHNNDLSRRRFWDNLKTAKNQHFVSRTDLGWPFNLLAEVNDYRCLPVNYAPTDDILAGINYVLDHLPGKLAERRKQEIVMYYRDGHTIAEIADNYGISKQTISMDLLRSLQFIRSNRFLRRAVLFGLSFAERENDLAHQKRLLTAQENRVKRLLEASARRLADMQDTVERALSHSIDELGLSVREYNALKRAGINNLEDLNGYIYGSDGAPHLMEIRGLGVKGARNILQKVYNLTGFNLSEQPSLLAGFEFKSDISLK